jgi:hypothetical protein
MLAGMAPSDDPRELDLVFERALKDLGIRSVAGDAAIKLYVAEMLAAYLRGEATTRDLLEYLQGVCVARDHARYLHDFYLLHFALIDLERYGDQHYWPSATRKNVHEIVRTTAQSWLAEHLPTAEPAAPAVRPRD